MSSGRLLRKALFILGVVASVFFALWPLFIGLLEGFDMDIGPLFSGKGITFVGGVPYFPGGFNPSISNLINAFSLDAFPRLVLNSVSMDILSIVMAVLAAVPAAYFLARSKAKGKGALGFIIIALRTASPFALAVPLYLLFVRSGLWDTYLGLAVAYLTIDIPVIVWMLRGFFAEVPKEVYEAAEVSGASEMEVFRRVALPQVLAGVAITAVFAFVLLWNEFLLANILTGGAAKTVSVGIWTGAGQNIGSFKSVEWDATNLLGFLGFVPVYAIMILIRKYLARGFTLGLAR